LTLPLDLPRKGTFTADEGRLKSETLKALQRTWPEGLFYRRNVGAARTSSGRLIRFGLKGQADIAGIITGLAVEIELKTENVAVTIDQRNWQRAVRRAGGIAIVAMTAVEAVVKLQRALAAKAAAG
jgi:hypothetical protein